MVIGYSLSWSGPIIPKLQNLEDSPLPYLLTETQISLVGSLAFAGSIPGPFLIAWLSNYKGRKPCFILSGITAIIAYTILSTSKNLTMLYCGRVLNTFATAMIAVNNLVYMGEVASVAVRGSFLAAFGVFTSLGSILVFSTAPFFPYYISTYIGLALSVLFTMTVISIPESPLFYILKGFGILPMTLIGEIFTLNVRSKGSAVVLGISWMFGFLLTTAFGVVDYGLIPSYEGRPMPNSGALNRAEYMKNDNSNLVSLSSSEFLVYWVPRILVMLAKAILTEAELKMIISLSLKSHLKYWAEGLIFAAHSLSYMGQLVIGFTLAWTGPIIPKLQHPIETPLSVQLSNTQLSLVASIIYIGAMPGPYITGWLSNVKGRKPCIIIAGVVLTISYLILAISNNLAMIYCGRLLTGFGIGCLTMGFYFFFDYKQYYVVNNIRWLPIVILIVFFFVYDLGLGIIPSALIGEMFKTNVRSKGSAVAITSSWVFGFLVTTAFGSLIDIVGAHVLFWFFSCYIGQLVIGFTLAWTGPIIPKLQDPIETPLSFQLSDTQLSLVASIVYIGAIPGPYIMGWLSNVKGRKPCIIIAGVVSTTAYLILAFSNNLAMIYCGRLLTGFGLGCVGVMNLVYIGEIASTNIRGILLTIIGIFQTAGAILAYASGLFLSYVGVTSVGFVLAFIFTIFALFLPESPMFHVLKGEDASVRKVLEDLGRSNDIEEMIASKKEFVNSTAKKDWKELFTDADNRKALNVLILGNIFLQCSGIIAVVFFSGTIFSMAGSTLNSNVAMIIICSCELSGSMLVPFMIEKCGRKILMKISCILCSLSMLTMGFYFFFDYKQYSVVNNIRWLPIVILIVFFFVYDLGLGIIPSTLIGEMFKTNVRSKGSAVAITSSLVFGFLVTTAFGSLIDIVGAHVLFWFFSCSSALAFIFTQIYIPETKGKSLLEIQTFKK
ncbi:unnamed protein product, partial [Brenthis ino]